MPSEKRQRQDEGRLQRRIEQQAVAKRTQRNRNAVITAVVVVVLLGGFFVYSLLSHDSDDAVDAAGSTTTSVDADASTTTAAGTDSTATTVASNAAPGDPAIGTTDCPPADGSAKRQTSFTSGPKSCIDVDATYVAKVETSKGTFEITLDPKAAPKTVNNFVFLARYHFYDGVSFHRIIPGFVVQGGDATGNPPGTGGPGYEFADELPTGSGPYYEVGSLAMANSGANTNGSQFFVVTGDQGAQLPAQYSRFGKVTSGMDVVKQIEATGTSEGTPSSTTTMTKVTITES
jgi:cyclophilin family peptidyl-prolyl cis-trans isomerase